MVYPIDTRDGKIFFLDTETELISSTTEENSEYKIEDSYYDCVLAISDIQRLSGLRTIREYDYAVNMKNVWRYCTMDIYFEGFHYPVKFDNFGTYIGTNRISGCRKFGYVGYDVEEKCARLCAHMKIGFMDTYGGDIECVGYLRDKESVLLSLGHICEFKDGYAMMWGERYKCGFKCTYNEAMRRLVI